MGIIAWIVLGGIAGWIATIIMGTNAQHGIMYNIVMGIIGALVGGFIVGLFGVDGISGFNITSLLVAVLGAALVIWATRKIGHRS